jgi:hypothetical protein
MNMLHTAEKDMANSVKPSDIEIFLSNAAYRPFALPAIQYSEPRHVQQYMDETCSLTAHS